MRGFADPALTLGLMASGAGVDTNTSLPDGGPAVLELWGMDYRLCRGFWCEYSFIRIITESHFAASDQLHPWSLRCMTAV